MNKNVMKKVNKKIKKNKLVTNQWEELYKTEEPKYKKYIELTQVSNLTEVAQSLSQDFSKTQILTDY